MYYYREHDTLYLSPHGDLPLPPAVPLPRERPLLLFRRPPQQCRSAFAVSHTAQLTQQHEGVFWLDEGRLKQAAAALPPGAPDVLAEGPLRALNFAHPAWRRLRAPLKGGRKRLHVLALGDVGATLLLGLRLLGGDVLHSIGICDLDEKAARRWEFEINQVALPWAYDSLPAVQVVAPEALFDCDVFVFCASRGLPPPGAAVADVRMAQWQANREIIAAYARQAREARFDGLFAVVSDPVDLLCREALHESNRAADGAFDGLGLRAEQIQGYGLGVMNARAAYYAQKEPRFASFLNEGRAYGPHGADLVIANSLEHYDDALSRELTQLAVTANLQLRRLGYKPYVGPALSSGALSLLLTMRGDWHYSSTFLGGVFMGAKNRFTAQGLETEIAPLPAALYARIAQAAEHLAAIE